MKFESSNSLHKQGFTLIEILIVIIILGILAVLVIPQFAGAAASARDSALRESVNQMRTQISSYMIQHRDSPPDAADETTFRNLMLQSTDENGNIGTGLTYRYGPYLTDIPLNAVNGKRTIMVLTPGQSPSFDNSTGWIYQIQPSGGFIFLANSTGQDSTGMAYKSY